MAHFKVYGLNDNNSIVYGAAYTTVPPGTNDVGVLWSEAVVGWTVFTRRTHTTEARSPVDAPTQAALDAGTLFEWLWDLPLPIGTPAEKVQAIRHHINTREAQVQTAMSERLRYWGFEGDS